MVLPPPVEPPSVEGAPLTRRALLGLGLAATTAVVTGCGAGAIPPSPPTVSTVTATDPFFVAHRGGGGNWPELTAYAYAQAAKIHGLQALEISVCLSSDAVLVCSHDPTTARVTGKPYVIAEETWDNLSTLTVSAAETTDPSQAGQAFTRFDEVVERYIGSHVLFVEPKVAPASEPLMRRLLDLGQPERVVWKQPVNSPRFATAKRHGFGTWGYVLDEPAHLGQNLTRFSADPALDMIGAQLRPDKTIAVAVAAVARAQGKHAIMWPIRSVDQVEVASRLGFRGMMTANLIKVLGR